MIEFPEHKDCKLCPLWESATNPGIPTRPYSVTGKSTAVLIVGEAPGYNEDREFKSWIGHAGTILTRFIDISGITEYADVYLANAGRCRPLQNDDPSIRETNTCRVHLQADLDLLCNEYEKVIILCAGRWGTTAVTKQTTLNSCFSRQARTLSHFNSLKGGGLESTKDIPVFFTYHPAMLLPHRKPAKVTAVADHFTLLLRYLKGDFFPNSIDVVPEYGVPVPAWLPELVCVDIETYGILKGRNQTVFHPMKSLHIDGVPLGEQVITVAFGYIDKDAPTGFRTYVYDFQKHRHLTQAWFRKLGDSPGTTLLGQNIKFDLLYLKANDVLLNYLINPLALRLDDTLLASFLFYEQRPEKGLKELATLFGLTDYGRLKVTAKSATAKSAKDPNLLYYNCLDVATTLALYTFTWEQIEKEYGKNSSKLGGICTYMRNAILWDTIMLEQAGCAMDVGKLERIDTEYKARLEVLIKEAAECGVIIAGEGSEASCRKFMRDALEEAGVLGSPHVQLTKKKKEISVGKDNFNFLLDHSTENHKHWKPLQILKEYHTASKVVNTYTDKLLNVPTVGIVHDNMTYPSWYPMPALAAKYEKDTEKVGGTIQGRFSAKKPAKQTEPALISNCNCSRFVGGRVVEYDLSQMELRIAGLMSGDEAFMKDFEQGGDIHTETALFIWPDADVESEDFAGDHGKRWAAKQGNFLVIYHGGALKLQETIFHDSGEFIPLARCKEIIDKMSRRYYGLRLWQDKNIEIVKRTGYLELPTGWSRYWGKGQAARLAVPEICDFPIQTIAAQCLQSSHFEVEKGILRRHLRTRIVLQKHDSLYKDGPIEEEPEIDEIMSKHLTHPPLLAMLEKVLGRTIPITFKKTILT